MRRSISLGLLLLGSMLQAAPVPTPRTATAEFRVRATTEIKARELVNHVQNPTFFATLIQKPAARNITCLKREINPRTWLQDHLKTELIKGKTGRQDTVIRIRLVEAPARDATALISLVASHYEQQLEQLQQSTKIQLLQIQQQQQMIKQIAFRGRRVGGIDESTIEKRIQDLQQSLEDGKIVEKPRLVTSRD